MAAQNFYNTSFPTVENPTSEGGNWITGAAMGTNNCGPSHNLPCLGAVQTFSGGHVGGTNVSSGCSGSNPTACNDSSANLTGTWTANQAACGTVFIGAGLNRANAPYEIEIKLRNQISANFSSGYEFNYSMFNNGNQYMQIVRGNGALGDFVVLTTTQTPGGLPPVINNGDTFCASVIGSTLTSWVVRNNAVLVKTTASDPSGILSGGAPGVGFFNTFAVGDNANFGFSTFTAANYAAATGNQPDLATLINGPTHTAVDGDSFLLPPGSYTWTTGVSAPSNIGIQIFGSGTQNVNSVCTNTSQVGCGAGTPTTVITDSPSGGVGNIFNLSPTVNNALSRVSTLSIQNTGTFPAGCVGSNTCSPPLSLAGTCDGTGCPDIRVDNIVTGHWDGLGIQGGAFIWGSNVFGVLDHNTATYNNVTSGANPTFIDVGHGHWLGVGNWGDNSWHSAGTFGTKQQIYLENNILNGVVGTDTEIFDGSGRWGGGRYACRFNYFPQINVNGACTGHGTDTTGRPRGTRQWEAYGNFLVCANASQGCNSAWPGRSGVGRSHSNTVIQSGGNFKGLGGPDTQRQYRPDTQWGGCAGLGPFDTNDGVIYYSGVVGTVTGYGQGAPGGTITDASFPGLTNTVGARYSFVDTSQSNFGFPLSSVAPGVLKIAVGNFFNTPVAGNNYQIQRATACIDQTGHSGGVLVQDSSDTNGIPVLSTTLSPGPVNQSIDPVYEANDTLTGTSASHTYSSGGNVIMNRDIFSEAVAQVAQTSPTFPFSGISIQQPVSSWSCNSTTCTWTVPSTAGFAVNGYVNVLDTAPGATNNRTNNNPAQITALTATTVTGTVPGVFPDTGGAGGVLLSIGAGHGTLANRPTCSGGCLLNAAYFATDQGSWNTVPGGIQGVLFVWNGTTWTTNYTPFTYPHPLVGTATATPVVTLSPSTENCGSVNVGSSANCGAVVLTNASGGSITISSVTYTGTNSTDFSSFSNTCSGVVANNSTCTVVPRFTPSINGAEGTALLNIAYTGFTGSPVQSGLTGTGVGAPIVLLSPAGLNFNPQQIGTSSASQPITLQNTGNAPLTITSIALGGANPGDYSQTNNCPGSLGAGLSCTVNVTFTPTVVGSRPASLLFTDNAAGSPQSTTLTGSGLAGGTLSFTPSSIAFSSQIINTSSGIQLIYANNTGSSPVTFGTITITGANFGDFFLTNNTACNGSIPVGGTCIQGVGFLPTATGLRQATVIYTDNGTGSPQQVNITGIGIPVPTPQPVVSGTVGVF